MTRTDQLSTHRPTIDLDPGRVRGLGGVGIVLRRELATKFLTKAYLLSTLLFAAIAVLLPLAFSDDAGPQPTAGGMSSLLLGLGFAVAAAVVVLLWGIPLATDVMQEKASRVVEILLTSIRPWQLLAGKVISTAIIGLTQLGVVLAATLVARPLTGKRLDLAGTDWEPVAVGVPCLALGVLTCSTLMAGLASRVERQEDLSGVLQPAMTVTMLPVAAAVYLCFEFADSIWLDVASIAPVFNTFVLPGRMAVETVPGWQIALSLAVAVGTTVAAFRIAGRVYAGAVLRSGGRVSLRDALQAG